MINQHILREPKYTLEIVMCRIAHTNYKETNQKISSAYYSLRTSIVTQKQWNVMKHVCRATQCVRRLLENKGWSLQTVSAPGGLIRQLHALLSQTELANTSLTSHGNPTSTSHSSMPLRRPCTEFGRSHSSNSLHHAWPQTQMKSYSQSLGALEMDLIPV